MFCSQSNGNMVTRQSWGREKESILEARVISLDAALRSSIFPICFKRDMASVGAQSSIPPPVRKSDRKNILSAAMFCGCAGDGIIWEKF